MNKFLSFIVLFQFLFVICKAQTYQFTTYNMANTPGVFSTDVFKTATTDGQGRVWIGSNSQGLYYYDTAWHNAGVLATHNIMQLVTDPTDGTIWAAQRGTGSTGSGTNTNGGVNHILTPTTNDYYGYLSGMPSRAAWGVTVFPNGDVFSTHGGQTTGGNTDGGGLGKISNGQTTGSSFYTALDYQGGVYNGTNNVPYYGQIVHAIGNNGSEFWVNVVSGCDAGNCTESRINRYSSSGNFLGSFTAANCPIPFVNGPSPVARAIFFDSQGRVWIGMNTGGIFIYDSNGNWTHIDETNSPFPAGAAVNFHSIAEDLDGYIYMGTSAGLLVFDNSSLTGGSAYALYDANNGLPSSNVAGITVDNSNMKWLATSGGIVKMEDSPESTISGTVYNVSINPTYSTLTNTQFPGCKVVIHDNNGLFNDSIITDNQGYFEFDSLDNTHSYNVEIIYNGAIAITCSIQNANIGIPYSQIKLPFDLHGQLINELSKMPVKTFDFSWLFGLTTLGSIDILAYDTVNLSQFETNMRTFTYDEQFANVPTESIARVLAVCRVMNTLGHNASKMTGMFTQGAFDIGTSIFQKAKTAEDMRIHILALLIEGGPQFYAWRAIGHLFAAGNSFFNAAIKRLISQGCSYIDDAQTRNSVKQVSTALYDAASNIGTQIVVENGEFQPVAQDVIKTELIGNTFTNIAVPSLYKFYYVPMTESALSVTETIMNSTSYINPINTALANTISTTTSQSKVEMNSAKYLLDSSYIATTTALSGFANQASNILNYGALITAPLGPGIAAAIKGLAKTMTVLNWSGKITGLAISSLNLYNTTKDVILAPSAAFFQTSSIVSASQSPIANVQQYTNAYNQEINEIGTFLQNDNRDSIIAHVDNLIYLDSVLSDASGNFSDLVFAVSPYAYQIDTTFDEFLTNVYINNSLTTHTLRNAFYYDLVAYLLDSTVNYADSILLDIPAIVQNNNSLFYLYDSLSNQISSYPVNQPIFVNANYQGLCTISTQYSINASVNNITTATIPNAYALLTVNNGLSTSTDSVYIGNLNPGINSNIIFQVITPSLDTNCQFYITVFGGNGETDAIGGDIRITSSIITNTGLSNKLQEITFYPNPTTGNVQLLQNNEKVKIGEVTVTDVTGRTVWNGKLQEGQLDLSSLNNGIYFLKTNNGNFKVVKE